MFPSINWIGTSSNPKTGNIPTAFVGASRDESLKSCEGCPLLARGDCYSQNGRGKLAHSSMLKSVNAKGASKYTLAHALKNRSVTAKFVRFTAIGDGARCNPEEVKAAHETAKSAGLGWLSYTHFWKEAAERGMQKYFVASVEMHEIDAALDAGFSRAAVTVEWDYYARGERTLTLPSGRKGIICPALSAHAKGKRVTCNDCGLCDPSRKGPDFVMFPEHGPGVKARIKKAAANAQEWAVNLMKPL